MGILRFFLAMSVVFVHSSSFMGWRLMGGLIAVEAFFILSGFYMALILDTKYIGARAIRAFLFNRFLRIFPIYWAVLALTLVWFWVRGTLGYGYGMLAPCMEWSSKLGWSTMTGFIVSNVTIVGQDLFYFLRLVPETGHLAFTSNYTLYRPFLESFLLVGQAWSLAIELIFYLAAPLLVRLSSRFLAILMGVSFVAKVGILFGLGWYHEPWTIRCMPLEMHLFIAGILSYRLYRYLRSQSHPLLESRLPLFLVLGATVFYQFIPGGALRSLCYLVLVALVAPVVFAGSEGWRFNRFLGDLSYPLYIVHICVAEVLRAYFTAGWQRNWFGIVVLIISCILGQILIIMIGRPVERVRSSIVKRFRREGGAT